MENCHDSYGRIIECDPPRRLTFTWDESTPSHRKSLSISSPRGDEVLLVVTHRRLDRAAMLSVAGGWHTHLDILVDNLNGNVPRAVLGHARGLEAEYAQRFDA